MPAEAPYIGVIGASQASERELALAERVGELIAARGAVVICGGEGGVMDAVSRGATRSGGMVVGLLPGEDRSRANPWLTVALPTGLGELRNALIVRACNALIAVGGSWGTLSEIALALRVGRPVFGLGTWELERPGAAGAVVAVSDPAEAVEAALAGAPSGS
ncbi:MAG: TIGR00725 family protein [Solirubrobacteraceae bacterium]|nr:MAG: TIGR00725 family protein [Solirubrobacterales bacterium]